MRILKELQSGQAIWLTFPTDVFLSLALPRARQNHNDQLKRRNLRQLRPGELFVSKAGLARSEQYVGRRGCQIQYLLEHHRAGRRVAPDRRHSTSESVRAASAEVRSAGGRLALS